MYSSAITFAKRSLHTYLDARHSPLPAKTARAVRKAVIKLNRSKLRQSGTIDFLGYQVAFNDEASLRHLVGEIWSKASYYFEPDNDAPVIFDCGSNIGMSVLFFKKLYPEASITAFEPDPATFSLLTKNIEANRLSKVAAHQIALAGTSGEAEFNRDRNPDVSSLTMSLDRDRHDGHQIKVQLRPLSGFIAGHIDLLKLDVEGAEYEVISELAVTGKLAKIRCIHMEYHHHVGGGPDNFSLMLRLLEDSGFSYQITAEAGPFSKHGQFQDVSLYCYRRS